jgi:predicted DNA-binding transcriptional regulator AlpA
MSKLETSDDRFLTTNGICERYGVHATSIDRWLKIEPNFPRPITIGGRHYYSLAALQEFERNAVMERHHRTGRFKPGSNKPPQRAGGAS